MQRHEDRWVGSATTIHFEVGISGAWLCIVNTLWRWSRGGQFGRSRRLASENPMRRSSSRHPITVAVTGDFHPTEEDKLSIADVTDYSHMSQNVTITYFVFHLRIPMGAHGIHQRPLH